MSVLGLQMFNPSFQAGAKMMVFLDSEGRSLWADAASTNLVAALVAWRRATTEELRRKLLTKWKNGKPGTLQTSAAAQLEMMDAPAADAAAPVAEIPVERAAATALSAVVHQAQPAASAATQVTPRERWRAPAPTWPAPGTAKLAEARLNALWPAMIEAAGDRLAAFARAAPVDCSQWASILTAREAAQQVRDTMGNDVDPAILGSLAALDALGNAAVWNASCSHHFDTVFAYLRASDGSLVMLWQPPEG